MTDQQTMTCKATNCCQHQYISILTHKKIENMNNNLRFYIVSAISDRALEFPVNFVWTETCNFTYNIFECSLVVKTMLCGVMLVLQEFMG